MIKSKHDIRAADKIFSEVIDVGTVTSATAINASRSLKDSNCIVAMLLTCAIADVYDLSLDFDFEPATVYKTLQQTNPDTQSVRSSLTPFLLLTQYPAGDSVADKISAWRAARSTAAFYANLHFTSAKLRDADEFTADEQLFIDSDWIVPHIGDIANNASNIMLKVWEEKQPPQPIASKIVVTVRDTVRLHANKTVVDFFDNVVYNSKLHRALWDPSVSYNYNDLQYCLSMEEKH
jgi:hypothetical protein